MSYSHPVCESLCINILEHKTRQIVLMSTWIGEQQLTSVPLVMKYKIRPG